MNRIDIKDRFETVVTWLFQMYGVEIDNLLVKIYFKDDLVTVAYTKIEVYLPKCKFSMTYTFLGYRQKSPLDVCLEDLDLCWELQVEPKFYSGKDNLNRIYEGSLKKLIPIYNRV